LVRRPPIGQLYQPPMMDDDECGAVGGMIYKGNWMKEPTPVPLCPQQIPHDPGSNPYRRSEKPATNRLSYGTALNEPHWPKVGNTIIWSHRQILHIIP
jgi:hypothetical protein